MYELSFVFNKTTREPVRIYIGKDVTSRLVHFLDDIKPDKVFIICDSIIKQLFLEEIEQNIAKKYDTHVIIHDSTEANKSIDTIAKMSDEFFLGGGTPNSCICAVGGGITGNMSGFLASILFRGIKLVHIPTTLLAQLDSAADVKQSVNSANIKNSIGSYKAPSKVIINPDFLKSLSDRVLLSGLSEALKHGIAQDLELVNFIESVDYRQIDSLEEIIYRTISLKLEHWIKTPTIWNDKKLIQRLTHLGHTTGKILEMTQADYLTHGEAIAIGMAIEAHMSYLLGYLDFKSAERVYDIFAKMKLLYPLSNRYNPAAIESHLYNEGTKPVFALLRSLGNPNTISTTTNADTFRKSVKWYFNKRMADNPLGKGQA